TPVTVLYSDAQGLGFAGADSMAGVIARDCGFSLAQPPAPVAPESPLPSITTDWLYYAVADGAANPTTDPAWAALPAVEKNQAIEVDYSLWFEAPSILAATKILNTYTQGPGK
ncbi:MAG: hypothetical protein Q3972_09215, partial [Corynebacterium sp.]|nr:hypothetical protein [Corynebacterium sp.]